MKRIITGILSAAMLFSGISALAENKTGSTSHGGGKVIGSETAYGTIKVEIWKWELRNIKNYKAGGVVTSSYAAGGPTVDENGDCLVPLTDMSHIWNYDIKDENNTITLSNKYRTIVVPYEGDTAVIDGQTIDFPHEHVVPMYASWDSVVDNEIYFHYSYLPAIFGVEKAEWDKDNMRLLITENETTPMSDEVRNWLKSEAESINNMSTATDDEKPSADGMIHPGAISIYVDEWDEREVKDYGDTPESTTLFGTGSYAYGGPTTDDNGDCLVPVIDLASVMYGYNITESEDYISLDNGYRNIIIPYEGNTAVVDGTTIDFPHQHIVPKFAEWEYVQDNEIYCHYSYLPNLLGVEKVVWDKDKLHLYITDNEATPVSDTNRDLRKSIVEDWRNMFVNGTFTQPQHENEHEIEPRPQTDNRSAYIGTPSQFTDITDTSSILNTCVNQLVDRGVIKGYDDNTFRPDAPVTRAEASAMICRLMGFELNGVSEFSDVPADEWYSDPIGAISEIGMVNGYDDGTFRPDNNITYHEMLKLAYCLLGQPNTWYSSVVSMAVAEGLTNELNSFSDNAAVTRGDMCILLSKLIDTYITTFETDDGNVYYGELEMTLSDYLDGYPTVYHYFCSQKQMDEYGATKK